METQKYNLLQNLIWSIKLNWNFSKLLFSLKIVQRVYEYSTPLIGAAITGLIIDGIITYTDTKNPQSLYIALGLFIVYYVLFRALFASLNNYTDGIAHLRLNYELPERLRLSKVKTLSIGALESPELQNLHTRFIENTYPLSQFFSAASRIFVIFFTILASVAVLISLIPAAVILLIILTLPTYFVSRAMIKKLFNISKGMTIELRRESSVYVWLSDAKYLKEIKQLKAFDYLFGYMERYILERHTKRSGVYVLWGKLDVLTSVFVAGAIILAIVQLVELAVAGAISIGQIAFLFATLNGLSSLIDQFFSYFADLNGQNDNVQAARSFLDYKDTYQMGNIVVDRFNVPPHIKLNNISFSYPNSEKLILKDLNLEIRSGEKIAIVGENGAGKSTLMKLISGVYPISQGQILINNQNLNEFEQDSWFKNLGVLYQDYNIYEDLSAFENIAMGNIDQEIDYPKLQDAARKADAESFIMDYKDNYSQILSERYEGGVRPSTGQWQKIAIARFFYRDAPILILDEPTASIDAVAEANIFERIYEFTQNKTVIIVSHRFSTVRNADRILVMDQGQIVEDGTHEQLMKVDGKYANAFKLQAKGYN